MKRITYLATLATIGLLAATTEEPVMGATTRDVDMIGFAFSPSSITIQSGDSVRWTQRDDFTAHTSTSGTPPSSPNGLWDSGFLSTGDSFTRLFTQAGTFPYYCIPH